MGIWDFMNSSTDKLKQNAPNLTPVTAACRSSYSFSRNAVTKVNTAVTGTVVPTLNHYVAEEEGRAKIGRFATSFVKNAAFYGFHEGLKWIPGGVPVYKIASRSLCDEKSENHNEVVKKLQARIDRLERDSHGGKNIQDDVKFERESSVGKNNQADVKFYSQLAPCLDSNAHVKPDDMIRIFMMKEFGGRCMFDDLLVPGVRRRKNSREEP